MTRATPQMLLLLLAAAVRASPQDDGDADADYIDSICWPSVENSDQGSLPPCIAIENIEAACQPNGTSSLALEAHAQCMCGGGYFAQWDGCQECLYVHGARSEREDAYWANVMTAASSMLCETAAPTAPLQELFTRAQSTISAVTTGATSLTDLHPSETAVSLYYTATGGAEGPGAITGSATRATATPTPATTPSSSKETAPTTTSTTDDSDANGEESTETEETSTSEGLAAPTGFPQAGILYAAAAAGAAFMAV